MKILTAKMSELVTTKIRKYCTQLRESRIVGTRNLILNYPVPNVQLPYTVWATTSNRLITHFASLTIAFEYVKSENKKKIKGNNFGTQFFVQAVCVDHWNRLLI